MPHKPDSQRRASGNIDAMSRGEQYTLNKDTDLYVSDLAEEELENPFQQDPTDEVIADPDAAAAAALMSRQDANDEIEPSSGRMQRTETSQNGSMPPSKKRVDENSSEGPAQPHIDEAVDSVDDTPDAESDHNGNARRRRGSSLKRSRNTLIDEIAGNVEEVDPETRHLAKRARRDSHAILVQPGDDIEEEDAKMRANLIQHGILPEDDMQTDETDEGASSSALTEDAGDTTEVEPVEQLDNRQQNIHKSSGDDDDDIEAKRGDDYDPENYIRFEDDEDDAEEDIAENGPEMDERLMIDEEQLLPGSGDEASER